MSLRTVQPDGTEGVQANFYTYIKICQDKKVCEMNVLFHKVKCSYHLGMTIYIIVITLLM